MSHVVYPELNVTVFFGGGEWRVVEIGGLKKISLVEEMFYLLPSSSLILTWKCTKPNFCFGAYCTPAACGSFCYVICFSQFFLSKDHSHACYNYISERFVYVDSYHFMSRMISLEMVIMIPLRLTLVFLRLFTHTFSVSGYNNMWHLYMPPYSARSGPMSLYSIIIPDSDLFRPSTHLNYRGSIRRMLPL